MKTNIPLHIQQFRSGYRSVVRRFGGTLPLAMSALIPSAKTAQHPNHIQQTL